MNRYRTPWMHRSILDYSIDKQIHKALESLNKNGSVRIHRLMMMVETNSPEIHKLIGILLRNQLINIVGEPSTSKPTYSITQKGKQLLVLLDKQAEMVH